MITGGPDPVASKPDPLQSTPSSSIYSEIVPDAESATADTQAIADKVPESLRDIEARFLDFIGNGLGVRGRGLRVGHNFRIDARRRCALERVRFAGNRIGPARNHALPLAG